MKTYEVKIQATITKIVRVEAKDVDEAYEFAHEDFSVLSDDNWEKYDQQTIDIREVRND
jgi:hypothetical protein